MPDISVETAGGVYRVVVSEGSSETTHSVTANSEAIARYGKGADATAVVAASFRFLLDREPKEAILRSFDLAVIERYFPEYPDRIGDYL